MTSILGVITRRSPKTSKIKSTFLENVDCQELGEAWSALCADNSAASVAAKRQRKLSAKVGEIAEGSTASKAFQIRDSDALLTLVESIIHGDHEHWGILLTKQRDKSSCSTQVYKIPHPSTTIRS